MIREGNGKLGRVLLRGRVETLLFFGLDDLPRMETAYERNGGIHVGKYRTSPRKVNWQSYRIGVPERYPSGRGYKGWTIGLSANHRLYDFATLAQVIEASGVRWMGFQRATGAKFLEKECLLPARPVAVTPVVTA